MLYYFSPLEILSISSLFSSFWKSINVFVFWGGCRRSLFRSSSILDHNEGSGPIAFAHKRVTPSFLLTTGSQAQCTSYFIEPVQWMESALLGVMDGQVRTHFIF